MGTNNVPGRSDMQGCCGWMMFNCGRESLVAIRSDGLSVEKVTWQPALGRT